MTLRVLIATGSTSAVIAPSPPEDGIASEDAVRLALRLQAVRPGGLGAVLVFVPASRRTGAAALVADAVRGLRALGHERLFMLDLRENAGEDDPMTAGGIAIERPFSGFAEGVRYASSADFAASLEKARSRFDYVLCVGEPLEQSLPTLVTAGLADGAILTVTPGQTTRTEVTDTMERLRAGGAAVIGFVADDRPSGRAR
jgi:hypothetical protein